MLSDRQLAFVTHYLDTWNASEAARRAGYRGDANTTGPRLLANVSVRAEIARRIEEQGVKSPEVLLRLTAIARGDMGSFFSVADDGTVHLDLAKAREAQQTGIIRRLHVTKDGGISIELYSAQDALVTLGKALGVLRENVRVEQIGELQVATRIVRAKEGV